MKKQIDKSKITIIILSIVFALSMSVTITLAAFSANKTGDVTLTFADGLTMTLTPKTKSGYITFTGGGVDEYTFTYTPQTQVTGMKYYNGINATLNKSGWVSYQVSLWETTSGSAVVPGSWVGPQSDGVFFFQATGAKNSWTMSILPTIGMFNISKSANMLTCVGNEIWASNSLSKEILDSWALRNSVYSMRDYVDDLAGRSFECRFTIKASTAAAPTF